MSKKPSIMERALGVGQNTAANKPHVEQNHEAEATATARPKTAPGALASFLVRESEIMNENVRLQRELQRWDGASVTRHLPPEAVVPSKYANRDERGFLSDEFKAFADEIESSGGNVQPVKVRPVVGSDPQRYEIVFGHRRHRACLERGQQLLATIEPIDDRVLFQEMDRENRLRADLSAYEQGEMYRKALDNGLYPSMRAMAEALGAQVGNVSTAIRIARLDPVILDAFPSRLDIRFRWGSLLEDALTKSREQVLNVAKEIAAERKNGTTISAAEALTRMCSATRSAPGKAGNEEEIVASGRRIGVIQRSKGRVVIVLDDHAFPDEALSDVLDAVRAAARVLQ